MSVPPNPPETGDIIEEADASLLDVIDNLLNRGVVVNGDVMLSLARVDLVYLRLSVLLCAADRMFASKYRRRSRGPHALSAPAGGVDDARSGRRGVRVRERRPRRRRT